MDTWLKGLIASACVVIIAGGAYFGWSEYQASIERKAAEVRGKERAQRDMCEEMFRQFKSGKITGDWRKLHLSLCINKGFLTEDDFRTNGLAGYLDEARSTIDHDREAKTYAK